MTLKHFLPLMRAMLAILVLLFPMMATAQAPSGRQAYKAPKVQKEYLPTPAEACEAALPIGVYYAQEYVDHTVETGYFRGVPNYETVNCRYRIQRYYSYDPEYKIRPGRAVCWDEEREEYVSGICPPAPDTQCSEATQCCGSQNSAGQQNPTSHSAGNPISLAHGIKTETVTDWSSSKDSRFSFSRTYKSAGYDRFDRANKEIGQGWSALNTYVMAHTHAAVWDGTVTIYGPSAKRIGFKDNVDLTPLREDEPYTLIADPDAPIVEGLSDVYILHDGSGKEITFTRFLHATRFHTENSQMLSLWAPSQISWPDGYWIEFTRDGDGRILAVQDNREHRAEYQWVAGAAEDGSLHVISQVEVDADYGGESFQPEVRISYNYEDDDRWPRGRVLAGVSVSDLTTDTVIQEHSYSYVEGRSFAGIPLLSAISDGRLDANGVPYNYAEFSYSDELDLTTSTVRATGTQHFGGDGQFQIAPVPDGTAPAGNLSVINPLGKETLYSYDIIGGVKRPTQIEGVATASCLASTKSLGYVPNEGAPVGYVYERVNRNGSKTTYERNSRGLILTKTEDADGVAPRVTTYTWHSDLRKPLTRETSELRETFTYDADGTLVQYDQTDVLTGSPSFGQTRSTTFTYGTTPNGIKVLQSLDGPGLAADGINDITTYSYNSDATLASVTDANGLVTTYGNYDAYGKATRIVEPNGRAWVLVHDAKGRVISATENADFQPRNTVHLTYDIAGLVTSYTNERGYTWTFKYNEARRLVEQEDMAGQKTTYSYDAMGNVTQTQILAADATVQFSSQNSFDELGRLKDLLGAQGQNTAFTYDVEDNLDTTTDALGHVTDNSYDALNRLTSHLDLNNSAETEMAHSASDEVTSYTDPRDITTSFAYNGFGEVVQEVSADRGTISYSYDSRGLTTSMTDGRGVVTNYTFDSGGRLTAKQFPATPAENQRFTYRGATAGGAGRIERIETPGVSRIERFYRFGELSRDRRRIHFKEYDVDYKFGESGLLDQLRGPGNLVVRYFRDTQQRVTSITAYRHVEDPVTGQYPPKQTIVSNIGYAPFGPINSLTYGDGAIQTRSYDGSYRLTRLLDDLNGTSLRDVSYGWSLRDNLLSTTDNLDSSVSEAFQYTAQQRLSEADGIYGDLDFAYDLNGNRTSRSVTNTGTTQSESYSYPLSSNRLQSTAQGASSRALAYDGAGNVTSDNLDGSIYAYSYDAANRMSALSINGVAEAEYRYNALGQQVSRYLVAEDKTIHTVHDLDGNRIAEFEYDPVTRATVLLREYIWLEGEPIAVVENDQIYYLRTDHIGRPRFATDAAGLTVWQANYLPFGKLHVTTGNNPDLRFPGQWFQAESGLFQNWMRDYDPTLGRYLQADPLGLVDGPSIYGYALQNPQKHVDPRGEQTSVFDLDGGVSFPGDYGGRSSVSGGAAVTVGGRLIGGVIAGIIYPSTPGNGELPLGRLLLEEGCGDVNLDDLFPPIVSSEEHTAGARPSTKGKHEKGQKRKLRDRGGESGDARRKPPRRRPDNHKGPWPPR